MKKIIYLDHAATTPLDKEVLDAMLPYFTNQFANPSSIYPIGIEARKALNTARKKIATLLKAKHSEFYFCSSGSEANNWAIKGVCEEPGSEIITTKIEHPATLEACKAMEKAGHVVHYIDVDEQGFIKLDQLKAALNKNTAIVSIVHANNEIGTIQNLDAIIKLVRTQRKAYLHIDAVQSICSLSLDLSELDVDLVSFTAHKMYGPKGVACLFARERVRFAQLIHGGRQEHNKRAGTENLPGIIGLVKALEISHRQIKTRQKKLRKLSEHMLATLAEKIPNVRLNGPDIGPHRLPNNLNVSFDDIQGSVLTYQLGEQGICISTGSACHGDDIEPSHVLKAIKVPKRYINGTIRVTFGPENTLEEVDEVVHEIIKSINQQMSA